MVVFVAAKIFPSTEKLHSWASMTIERDLFPAHMDIAGKLCWRSLIFCVYYGSFSRFSVAVTFASSFNNSAELASAPFTPHSLVGAEPQAIPLLAEYAWYLNVYLSNDI